MLFRSGGGAPIGLAPGEVHVHTAEVLVTEACGLALDIDVTNVRDGAIAFAEELALCDRAVALRAGRVEFDGPTSDYRGSVSGATESVELEARRL